MQNFLQNIENIILNKNNFSCSCKKTILNTTCDLAF